MTQTIRLRSVLLQYLGLAIAGSAAYTLSTLFSAMKPVLLTRYVEQLAHAEAVAGLIVALPFAGIACAGLLQAIHQRLTYRQISVSFGALLVLLEGVSMLTYEHLWLIMPVQFTTGICVGLLMGATSRLIATTDAAERLFGFVDMMAVLLMSAMVYGVGVAVELHGLMGGYGFATLLSLLYVSALVSLSPNGHTGYPGNRLSTATLRISWRPVLTIAMGVLFVTFSGLGFAFMFSMAADLGMGYDVAGTRIGILLFVSGFACHVGGATAARFGHKLPLTGAFICCALGWYLAVHATSQSMYLAALVPAIFSLQFSFPILLALCGALDDDGRWATIGTPLLTSGFAWAAIAAGLIYTQWGSAGIAWGTIAGMGVCGALLWWIRPRAVANGA
ncbi:MAG: hypothetical protein AAF513_06405 [Pseudomonadota bacterium]